MSAKKARPPITPGEILTTEFLEPLGVSRYQLAKATGLSQTCLSEIARGRRAITADTALRLSRALGVDDHFWVNLQATYDIEVALDQRREDIERVKPIHSPQEHAVRG